MQRTDIVEIFPEATKEQLDAIMGLNGADINAAKKDMGKLTNDLKAAQTALETAKTSDKSEELRKALEDLAAANTELNGLKAANEVRQIREKVSAAKGIPMNLLTGDTEAACAAQADAILAFAKPSDYPPVADGGEPPTPGGDAWTQFSAQLFKT